ncbi:HAD family hydrolase [Aquibacillus rhizosphaerae]|uniref:HAD-IA family hydrolase n=1 Tax=Aquibacillus rhizosphaerae TaxID=3051431 RepID=A0ABT7L965_9BACI|nr:HAD-IA family hydrolase [Aquibacillus sp. LR5S19]MDL4842411.1 HAD-IA family hydrolase [Aquibacillus sp. LR5S19]
MEVMQLSITDSLKDYGVSFDEPLITKSYWELFCSSAYLEPGAIEVLDVLSKKHRLFCMTNGYSESQRGRLKAANLEHYFEGVFISEELGVAKPNPKALEVCLEKLALNKDETIYIGDSLKNDYPAANGADIHFYLYNPTNIKAREHKGLTEFSHLKDLLDIL